MKQVDLSTFVEKYNIHAIIDNDPDSSKARNGFLRNCKKLNIPAVKLKRYSIENYFTLNAIKSVFPQVSVTEIKPDEKLENQISIDVKKRNGKIAKAMTLDDLKGTDLLKFVESIKEFCEKNQVSKMKP